MVSVNVERRLTLRLLSYWEKLRNGRSMPLERDIDPDELTDLWDSCFLIQVKDLSKNDYNYTYLGPKILAAYQHGLGREEAHGLISPNANKLSANYNKVIKSIKPLINEGEFTNVCGETIKYRQCLLPLGDNEKVGAIFGGMHYKIFL